MTTTNDAAEAMIDAMTATPGRLWTRSRDGWYDTGRVRLAVTGDEITVVVFDRLPAGRGLVEWTASLPRSVPAAVGVAMLEAAIKQAA